MTPTEPTDVMVEALTLGVMLQADSAAKKAREDSWIRCESLAERREAGRVAWAAVIVKALTEEK